MPRPARGPMVLFTPAGLAEMVNGLGGRKTTSRTLQRLAEAGEILPTALIYGRGGKLVAFAFSKEAARQFRPRRPGRPA